MPDTLTLCSAAETDGAVPLFLLQQILADLFAIERCCCQGIKDAGKGLYTADKIRPDRLGAGKG